MDHFVLKGIIIIMFQVDTNSHFITATGTKTALAIT
jgi:hypothetical protein